MKTNQNITSIIAHNIASISKRSPKDLLTYLHFINKTPAISPFEKASIKKQVLKLNNETYYSKLIKQ